MINILGSEWRIEKRKREEDPRLNAAVGYTDTSIKTIVVEEMEADADSKSDLEAYTKQVVRHEIIHAFCMKADSTHALVCMTVRGP